MSKTCFILQDGMKANIREWSRGFTFSLELKCCPVNFKSVCDIPISTVYMLHCMICMIGIIWFHYPGSSLCSAIKWLLIVTLISQCAQYPVVQPASSHIIRVSYLHTLAGQGVSPSKWSESCLIVSVVSYWSDSLQVLQYLSHFSFLFWLLKRCSSCCNSYRQSQGTATEISQIYQ